jgi:hypothetical protein
MVVILSYSDAFWLSNALVTFQSPIVNHVFLKGNLSCILSQFSLCSQPKIKIIRQSLIFSCYHNIGTKLPPLFQFFYARVKNQIITRISKFLLFFFTIYIYIYI